MIRFVLYTRPVAELRKQTGSEQEGGRDTHTHVSIQLYLTKNGAKQVPLHFPMYMKVQQDAPFIFWQQDTSFISWQLYDSTIYGIKSHNNT